MITVEQHTEASSSVLWDVISDLPSWAESLPTIDAITEVTDTGPALAARYRIRQPGLPEAVYEVTSWRPGAGFTWVSASRVLTTTATHEIRATGSGSTLTLGIAWSGPLGWLVHLVFGRKAAAFVTTEARTFADLAERAARDRA